MSWRPFSILNSPLSIHPMINWLIQTTNDQAPPPDWLSAAEQARYRGFKTAKRQQDWLLGRWTAKRLLQQTAATANAALHQIQIDSADSGAPIINPISAVADPPALSISHSHGHAFCAVAAHAIGADIERITPRSDTFVNDYFTKAEIEHLKNCQSSAAYGLHDTLVTAVWSAKEAVLKVLQLGLTVDTRAVTCLPALPAGETEQWTAVDIQLDSRRLPNAPINLQGWWRPWHDFVLTLAIQLENNQVSD